MAETRMREWSELYDATAIEQEYTATLPDWQHEDYRLFCIGLKMIVRGRRLQAEANGNEYFEEGNQQSSIAECYGQSDRRREGSGVHLGYGYLEYCPFGDLGQLIDRKGDQQFPELFIWLVFRGLAKALLILHCGRSIADEEPAQEEVRENTQLEDEDWEPQVNLDIKTRNICLGGNDTVYPAFKMPKMIDFGETYGTVEDAIDITRDRGTDGWRAPEAQTGPHPHNDAAITIATSIFQVGLVILNLVEGREILVNDLNQHMTVSPEYDGAYSAQLLFLVFDCLQLDPAERPTLWKILYETRRGIRRWQAANGDMTGVELDDVAVDLWKMRFAREEVAVGDLLPGEWLEEKRRPPAE
ncbi:kinase-like protein [Massarina eburnea CBS 473.64]|uniref:Kinase-like protein n=1 Tax=Massarina eburnea CBS 473.64 TaxID=1395130 RepID=A0A6A6RI58_9PLEO|nr:kinase-like protein [Massarina eburnea CBS 473.64]